MMRKYPQHLNFYYQVQQPGKRFLVLFPPTLDIIYTNGLKFVEHMLTVHDFSFTMYIPLLRMLMLLKKFRCISTKADLWSCTVECPQPRYKQDVKDVYIIQVDDWAMRQILQILSFAGRNIVAAQLDQFYRSELTNKTKMYVPCTDQNIFPPSVFADRI